MQNVRRHLILTKGDALFIYGYESGEEARVLETLIAQAKDERTDLDWFDVALLELKLAEAAGVEPKPPGMDNRFKQPTDGPLWFMRGLFGPDADRQ